MMDVFERGFRYASDQGETMSDPVLFAYSLVRRLPSGQGVWNRIGRAYPHETGAGLTVVLDALPKDGRIVLLEPQGGDEQELV